MNSHTLKITNLSELPNPLELERQYTITIKAEVTGIKKESNNDGTFTFTYSARQLSGDVVSDDGKVMKVEDKKSQSRKLLAQLTAIGADRGLDPSKFYEETMIDFRHFTLEILDFISSLKK